MTPEERFYNFLPRAKRWAQCIQRRLPWRERDEVYQEVVLNLWKAALSFDESQGAKFGTYAEFRMPGAMAYVCRNYLGQYRKRVNGKQVVMYRNAELGDPGKLVDYRFPSAEEKLTRADRARLLRNAMRRLTDQQRLCVREVGIKMKTFKEVGVENNRSYQAIQQSYRKAISILKVTLADREEELFT